MWESGKKLFELRSDRKKCGRKKEKNLHSFSFRFDFFYSGRDVMNFNNELIFNVGVWNS